MNLQESIRRILKEETLSESTHLRRRFNEKKLDREFKESIEYASKSPYKFESLEDLKHYVISIMIDGLHGELSNWGSTDFPYDEIYNYLKNMYSDQIEEYDYLIEKNGLTESRVSPEVRRRFNQIDKLVDVLLTDMYVDEYDSEEEFFDGFVMEFGFLVRNEEFELNDLDWLDIYDYIDQYKRKDINDYYNEHKM